MGKTAHFTRVLLLSIFRKPMWIILLMTEILVALGCYFYVYPHEPALALHMTAYGQLLLTITFMMLGIQLKSEPRRVYFDDIIAAYSLRSGFVLRCQLLTLSLVSLVSTLIILASIYLVTLIGAPVLLVKQFFAYVVLLYFLPCFILGAWGLLIAQLNKGRSVYFPAILVWLITSSLMADYIVYFEVLGFSIGRLFLAMFNMGIVGMRNITGAVMTPPIELPRWIFRLLIAVFLVAFLLSDNARRLAVLPTQKRKSKSILLAVILCSIAFISFFSARYAVFFARFADPVVSKEYTWEKSDQYLSRDQELLLTFPPQKQVTLIKTDIDLACSTQGIKGNVQMEATVDKATTGQSFTLYSDLIIDEILVDGIKADYKRAKDYIMVYFPEGKRTGDHVVFSFRYHGYSLPVFPANETTVQLNRAFPWFPWPGIKSAIKYSNFYSYSESEDFFIEDFQRGDAVSYTLQYNGPGDLYTNLDRQQSGLYTGISTNGVSLYSGMIKAQCRGVDVYTPASQYKEAQWAEKAISDSYFILKNLCDRMGVSKIVKPPKSIALIEMKSSLVSPAPFTYRSELYSWDDAWEIRMTSTSAAIISREVYGADVEMYRESMDARVKMPVAYLLTPCVGFPADTPHSSTKNFAAWLCVYLSAPNSDDAERKLYVNVLKEECSGSDADYVYDEAVPEKPITAEESAHIDEIFDRMVAGENFDEAFRLLYQRLLKKDMITPSEIITTLYDN